MGQEESRNQQNGQSWGRSTPAPNANRPQARQTTQPSATGQRPVSSRPITEAEVKRLLDQQKELYEKKLREVEIQTRNNNTIGEISRAEIALDHNIQHHIKKEAEKALDKKMTQQIQKLRQAISGTNLSPQGAGPSSQSQPSTPEYIRPLIPGLVGQNTSPANLYPNLDHVGTKAQSPYNPQYLQSNKKGDSFGQYVFVNSNLQGQGYVQPAPSAPPASHVNQTNKNTGAKKKEYGNFRPKGSTAADCCSTCSQSFGLKTIFQCADTHSHSSCLNCKQNGRPCGRCGKPITERRNFSLEDMMKQSKVPCPNEGDGCRGQWKREALADHLTECPYRQLDCPVSPGCFWRGKLSQMCEHVSERHPENAQKVDTEVRLVNLVDTNHSKHLLQLDEFKFLLHIKVDAVERVILMAVQLYDTKPTANHWVYEIQFYNKREPRRKNAYSDVCEPTSTSVEDLFQEYKCVSIPTSYAISFVNEGALNYKVYIRRRNEDYRRPPGPSSRGRSSAPRGYPRRGRGKAPK